jgi:hypothetical protein
MEEPSWASGLNALAELRGQLEGELRTLLTRRPILLKELEALEKDLESTRRQLKLVEATEEQVTAEWRERPAIEGWASKPRGQVRGSANRTSAIRVAHLGPVCVLSQPTLPTFFKRLRPSPPKIRSQPLPTRTLPIPLWEDHLLPLLTCKDAARLGRTCKALRGVVREHFKDIGKIELKALRAALTTFPRARSVDFHGCESGETDPEALAQWLHEGGRGRHLARVRSGGAAALHFTYAALRAVALTSLTSADVDLQDEAARDLLTEGFLGGMHELTVIVDCSDRLQLAMLGLVRQLPALAKLDVEVCGHFAAPVQWPPFIPPSLKALSIDVSVGPAIESLLRALTGMLVASGARPERLEVLIPDNVKAVGDGLVHLAQALCCCSPTLKGFLFGTRNNRALSFDKGIQDHSSKMVRLRVQWAGLLAGVAACRELQVLVLPRIEVEPLFPPGTAFARLTHLEIFDIVREHPPDAGVMGLWELMASGGLPALTKLKVEIERRRAFRGEVRSRVAPAFKDVAGTLTHLHLGCASARDKVEMGYEWGMAVGKLRRLKDLALSLSNDGRFYHGMAQGLAASGGGRPLPLLWRVIVPYGAGSNSDLLASLLLPSVRVFRTGHMDDPQAALMTACALREAGYKLTWELYCWYPKEFAGIPGVVPSCTFGNDIGQRSRADWCVSRLREL